MKVRTFTSLFFGRAIFFARDRDGGSDKFIDFDRKTHIVLVMFATLLDDDKPSVALLFALAATIEALASLARASETLAAEDAGKAAPDTPKHPGWPAGAPDSQGGKFRPKTPDEVAADRTERAKSTTPKAGSGMTEILAEAVKTAIRVFLSRAESAPHPGVRIAAFLAEVGLEAYPYVSAYFGEAKSLEELQAAAQEPSQTGYEDHHIVEQATANPDGSEDRQIEAPDNLARIPTVKHWELNRWYQTPNYSLEGLTPRKYLDGKSWEERRRVGLMGMRDIGVLK
jgi:hypothetical protein